MTLLAPGLAIAGILAAAVPIVIHLLLRRRRRPVEWAAMSLLMQAVRRHRRRARIERVLLLALRALLLAALGVALARPSTGDRTTIIGSRIVHLVVDDGIASGVRSGSGVVLDDSVAAAVEMVESLSPSDRVTLVLAGRPVQPLIEEPTGDHRSVVRTLEGLRPREGRTDLTSALASLVDGTADDGSGDRHEVRLFSDLRRAAIDDGGRPPDLRRENLDLHASTPATDEKSSTQVVDLRSARVPLSLAGGTDDRILQVDLRRTGRADAATGTVRLDGTAVAGPEFRTVDWPAGVRETTVDFQVKVVPEGGVLTASIEEQDDLDLDDRRSIIVEGRAPRRMLVLERDEFGGSGRVDRWRGTDWFERATLPMTDRVLEESIEIDRVDPATANARDLDGVYLAVLGRPDLVSDDFRLLLADWVRDGGVLVTMPPGSTTVRPWASPLLEALGIDWSVALEAESVEPSRRLSEEQPAASLTRLLDAELPGLAPSVSIERRLPIEGFEDGDLVLVDDAGDPVLLDVPIGLGRLVFFAVTPELEWTDLPVRPLMVPLVQEIGRQGSALAMAGRDGVVGDRLPTRGTEGATVVLPGGERATLVDGTTDRIPSRSGVVEIVDLADRVVERRTVNPAVDSAMLDLVSVDEVSEWLSSAGDWKVESADESIEIANIANADLAEPLIILVLALVLLETAFARWFARGGVTSRRSAGLTGANADAEVARTSRTGVTS